MEELPKLELNSEAKQINAPKNKPGRKPKPKPVAELDTESILERISDTENEIIEINDQEMKTKKKLKQKIKPDSDPEAEPEQRIYFIKGPVYLDFGM